jgi:hypothetical protein
LVKVAKLNASFKGNTKTTAIVSPAAKRIRGRLQDFLTGLQTGRFIATISAKLRKVYNRTGEMNFSLFKDYEIQPYFHLSNILKGRYEGYIKNNEFLIRIDINKDCIKKQSGLIAGYFFDAIILYGDPSRNNSLRVESDTSPIYFFDSVPETTCHLSLSLPAKKAWMVLLKASCMEGKQPALHPRHYGMRVLDAGQGK